MTAALASFVAGGIPADRWPATGCVAWVESRSGWCGRAADHRLCPRHLDTARRRRLVAIGEQAVREERRRHEARGKLPAARPPLHAPAHVRANDADHRQLLRERRAV